MYLLENNLFYSKNNVKYPPFKNGLYLEEYFLKYIQQNNISLKRKYIPAYWTNFQIRSDFKSNKEKLQKDLDRWLHNNPSLNGYFCIIQHADGSYLKLPKNCIVYNGGNSGNYPLPLIYEDINNTLINMQKKSFQDKEILCSFIGNITSNNIKPNVRVTMFNKFKNNKLFKMINSGGWTTNINTNLQKIFIDTTISSKFALSPRGYGRSSFRFYESFLLGTIPVYIWNDKNWLPFQSIIDYNKLCVVIHISEINDLEEKLKNITEEKYNSMWEYYNKIKHLYELEGMSKQIISEINIVNRFSLCITTMDRYDNFLSVNLPKYINNYFIDEIVICDENGNDVRKIKQNIKNIEKIRFYINDKRKGAFYNKLSCCKLAKNEWIALIDSDNFADIDYFTEANDYLKNIKKLNNKNIILSPSFAKPNFDFRILSNVCLKKGNFKNIPNYRQNTRTLINAGNYIINKYLVENLKLHDKDKPLIENSNACDVVLFNTLLFEQLNLEMYIVPNMNYEHVVHPKSTYLLESKKTDKEIKIVYKRYDDFTNN